MAKAAVRRLPPAALADDGKAAPGEDSDPVKFSTGVASAATPGWTTILFEDGEGSFPAANGWAVSDFDSGSGVDSLG